MLTLESPSVVKSRTPASGAFVAGVKPGADKMDTAWELLATPRNAAIAANNDTLRGNKLTEIGCIKKSLIAMSG